jgi:hypothetical protein
MRKLHFVALNMLFSYICFTIFYYLTKTNLYNRTKYEKSDLFCTTYFASQRKSTCNLVAILNNGRLSGGRVLKMFLHGPNNKNMKRVIYFALPGHTGINHCQISRHGVLYQHLFNVLPNMLGRHLEQWPTFGWSGTKNVSTWTK